MHNPIIHTLFSPSVMRNAEERRPVPAQNHQMMICNNLPPNFYVYNFEQSVMMLKSAGYLSPDNPLCWVKTLHLNTTVIESTGCQETPTKEIRGRSTYVDYLCKVNSNDPPDYQEIKSYQRDGTMQSDVGGSLPDALPKIPHLKTVFVGVGEKAFEHAETVFLALGCRINRWSSSAFGNLNILFSHILAARNQAGFRELVVLNPGLDLASPLPHNFGPHKMIGKLILFRAKVKREASHNPVAGDFVRAMKDLQRLELAGSTNEEEDTLIPLDPVIDEADWQSLRHCTFTGAKFSFAVLVKFLNQHLLEQISFRNVRLTGGTWAAVLSRLAEIEGSRLQRLDLGDELWADDVLEYKRGSDAAVFQNDAHAIMNNTELFQSSLDNLRKAAGMSHTCDGFHYYSMSTEKIEEDLPIDLITQYLI